MAAGRAVCGAAAAAGSGIEPWQLSMFLLQREEQAQRQRLRDGQAAAAAEAPGEPRRHVARGTVAY